MCCGGARFSRLECRLVELHALCHSPVPAWRSILTGNSKRQGLHGLGIQAIKSSKLVHYGVQQGYRYVLH